MSDGRAAQSVRRVGRRLVVDGERCHCGQDFVAWNKGIERLPHAPGHRTPVWRTFARLRCRDGHLTELDDTG